MATLSAPAFGENQFLSTFEAVTEGQLDKLCDFISDSVVDACFRQDPLAKVSVQCCIKSRMIVLLGEVVIKGSVDYDTIIRCILKNVGYDSEERTGLDYRSVNVVVAVSEASPDLVSALNAASGSTTTASATAGHGDYGTATGYATDEATSSDLSGGANFHSKHSAWTKYCSTGKVQAACMPLGHTLAIALARRLSVCRLEKELAWVNPNGKVQVTMKYEKNSDGSLKASTIHRVCVHAVGHDQGVSLKEMQEDLRRKVIDVVIGKETSGGAAEASAGCGSADKLTPIVPTAFTNLFTPDTIVHVNYSAHKSNRAFVGSNSDEFQGSGSSGQKGNIDFYGGDFSSPLRVCGRDVWKIERVASLASRWVAKSLVSSKLCRRCTVTISYTSNFAEPAHVSVESYGTSGKLKNEQLRQIILKNFDLKIGSVANELDLTKQSFALLSLYGYFGGFESNANWEKPKALQG